MHGILAANLDQALGERAKPRLRKRFKAAQSRQKLQLHSAAGLSGPAGQLSRHNKKKGRARGRSRRRGAVIETETCIGLQLHYP